MRSKTWLILGLIAVLAAGAYAATHRRQGTQQQAKAIYYCPMHPTYTSDKPGTCPICNMNLVKKEASAVAPQEQPRAANEVCVMHNCPMMHDGKPCPMLVVAAPGEEIICPVCKQHVDTHATARAAVPSTDYAAVLITPQKQQLIGVKTARVERRALTKTIRAAGTIAHDPELYQAQAEYIQAIQALAQAKQGTMPGAVTQAQQLVDSTRIRLKHLGLSDAMIGEIATWKTAEHGLLFAHPGDPVWMYAQIYEYELPLVRVGQAVAVDAATLPGETFGGTIRAIDAMVDPMTRTTRIRAQLEDPQGHLRPDMYVNAAIAVDVGEVLAVPEEAVFNTGTRQVVFVDRGEGLFEPRDVTIGAKADGYYEARAGVAAGDAVVTSGNFLIDSESRLKAALEGMSGGGHQHGQ